MIKMVISCDTPEKQRPGSSEHSQLRCYSSLNDSVFMYFEGDLVDAASALDDLCKLAITQGWRDIGRKIYCPGCIRRRSINR